MSFSNGVTTKKLSVSNLAESSFGDNISVELIPFIVGSASYNFLPANFRQFSSGTGSTSVSDHLFKVSTGATAGSYGAIRSFRSINYAPGEGALVRFGARWPSVVASSESGVGVFNVGDEFSFGYNGTSFGVWHRYGGKPEVRLLTITVGSSGATNATIQINGTSNTVPLTAGTPEFNAREITDYLAANMPGWRFEQRGATVQAQSESDGAKVGAFTFTHASASASWSTVTTGVTKISSHTPQASWNGALISGLDLTKGNTFQIVYQNGFGNAKFYIQDPDSGSFILVHSVKWTNTQTRPNLNNASLHGGLYVFSAGSTSDISVEMAFISGFSTGLIKATRNPRSFASTKNIGTTSTNIFTIRNKGILNGEVNQAEIEPRYLTLANDGLKSAIFEIRSNPVVGGSPNFIPQGATLISDIDTAGTTVSGGNLLATFVVAKGQNISVNIADLEIRIPPTLKVSISARMDSGAAADLSASLSWLEEL